MRHKTQTSRADVAMDMCLWRSGHLEIQDLTKQLKSQTPSVVCGSEARPAKAKPAGRKMASQSAAHHRPKQHTHPERPGARQTDSPLATAGPPWLPNKVGLAKVTDLPSLEPKWLRTHIYIYIYIYIYLYICIYIYIYI